MAWPTGVINRGSEAGAKSVHSEYREQNSPQAARPSALSWADKKSVL